MKEEIIGILRRLRKEKAPGIDGLENKAWRFMSVEIGEELWQLLDKIWRSGGLPEE